MSSVAHSLPARRIMMSLLALLVLIMTLPGPLSWACMLKSGSIQCCCVSIEIEADGLHSPQKQSCCHADDVALSDVALPVDKFGNELPDRDADDGDEPCDCGGDGPEQPSVEPKDGGDGVLAASIPVAGLRYVWPLVALQHVGADHETQERCTGPPLYVLYEVFLI